MTETHHLFPSNTWMKALFVGCVWMFFATMIGASVIEYGYSLLESLLIGIVGTPLSIVFLAVLGRIGLFVIEALDSMRVTK